MSDQKIKWDYEEYSDVLYVDLMETPVDAIIDTVDLGDQTGFPGQVLARYNPHTGELYGVVIEGYKSVEKKLKRLEKERTLAKRMTEMEAAIRCLLEKVKEAFQKVASISASCAPAYA